MGRHQDTSKLRKTDAEENFDQAENAGRFSGNDRDSFDAQKIAEDNIRRHRAASADRRNIDNRNENTEAEPRRIPDKAQDYKGEAQNVNDDAGRPLNEQELGHARNKANEGRENDPRKRTHTGG